MYTFVVKPDHSIIATQKEVIMQRSSVSKIQILVPKTYEDVDYTDANVHIEYTLPESGQNGMLDLQLADSNYKGTYLQYIIDATPALTTEAGDIKFNLSLIKLDANSDGNIKSYVRKTQDAIIHITPVTVYSDYIPDTNLTAMDQRIIMLQAMTKQLNQLQQEIFNTMNKDQE